MGSRSCSCSGTSGSPELHKTTHTLLYVTARLLRSQPSSCTRGERSIASARCCCALGNRPLSSPSSVNLARCPDAAVRCEPEPDHRPLRDLCAGTRQRMPPPRRVASRHAVLCSRTACLAHRNVDRQRPLSPKRASCSSSGREYLPRGSTERRRG